MAEAVEAAGAPGRRRRAPGMSADERRAMIVTAALPLVAEYGAAVTTAKVARAAGIGEATIFRVFEDKDALLAACVAEALRPDALLTSLAAISLDQPLADRLTEALDAMREHLSRIGAVIGALRATGQLRGREAPKSGDSGTGPDPGARTGASPAPVPGSREAAMAAPLAAVTALIEPDRDRLRMAPEALARVFLTLGQAATPSGEKEGAGARELVEVFLYGALDGGPGAEARRG
ncbi:TetR/AcrR family transcriptional regulator [Streptomyces albofaciens JCM 4342]|uniref:TetR/AcrR family transcriptional regulator n=1 Tax=Streptomyces albofaciens TaxID=66866 RepID=UPI00123A6763|nr:TetR/AcrR family transcriptional regulator [Streptomyces albofaciens]KAA6220708.1 TetR/AcrR family transcriptional regulator [Streptomyces albofaciens JCM 4342]